MVQMLGSMKISVMLPVTVREDNVGAIFIVTNITTTSCTSHRDIGYKYMNEYVEDGIVIIVC